MAGVEPVQGYVFQTVSQHPRNNDICQIVARCESDNDLLDVGPAFRVRFGDGEEFVASFEELRPWFPV